MLHHRIVPEVGCPQVKALASGHWALGPGEASTRRDAKPRIAFTSVLLAWRVKGDRSIRGNFGGTNTERIHRSRVLYRRLLLKRPATTKAASNLKAD